MDPDPHSNEAERKQIDMGWDQESSTDKENLNIWRAGGTVTAAAAPWHY